MSLRKLFARLKSNDKVVKEIQALAAAFDEAGDVCEQKPGSETLEAMSAASAALTKAITQARKNLGKNDSELEELLDEVEAEAKSRLKQAAREVAGTKVADRQKDMDDKMLEEDDSKLADPARVKLLMKQVANGTPMGFGFAEKPSGEWAFALHKGKDGKAIAAILKKDLKAKTLTFGQASAQDGALALDVQGKVLSGLTSKVKRWLADNKPTPFSKVRIAQGGKDLTDSLDPDAAAAAKDAGAYLKESLADLNAAWKELFATATKRMNHLRDLLKSSGPSEADHQEFNKLATDLQKNLDDGIRAWRDVRALEKVEPKDKATIDNAVKQAYRAKLKAEKIVELAEEVLSGTPDAKKVTAPDHAKVKKDIAGLLPLYKEYRTRHNDGLSLVGNLEKHLVPDVAKQGAAFRERLNNAWRAYDDVVKKLVMLSKEILGKGLLSASTDFPLLMNQSDVLMLDVLSVLDEVEAAAKKHRL